MEKDKLSVAIFIQKDTTEFKDFIKFFDLGFKSSQQKATLTISTHHLLTIVYLIEGEKELIYSKYEIDNQNIRITNILKKPIYIHIFFNKNPYFFIDEDFALEIDVVFSAVNNKEYYKGVLTFLNTSKNIEYDVIVETISESDINFLSRNQENEFSLSSNFVKHFRCFDNWERVISFNIYFDHRSIVHCFSFPNIQQIQRVFGLKNCIEKTHLEKSILKYKEILYEILEGDSKGLDIQLNFKLIKFLIPRKQEKLSYMKIGFGTFRGKSCIKLSYFQPKANKKIKTRCHIKIINLEADITGLFQHNVSSEWEKPEDLSHLVDVNDFDEIMKENKMKQTNEEIVNKQKSINRNNNIGSKDFSGEIRALNISNPEENSVIPNKNPLKADFGRKIANDNSDFFFNQ